MSMLNICGGRKVIQEYARTKIGLKEKEMVLFVGQLIHRNGIDVLLGTAIQIDKNISVYTVDGTLPDTYLKYINDNGRDRVHLVRFMCKKELLNYYQARDLFVLPTREDIQGLVVNEALIYGTPVIKTDYCVAGIELINGNNGQLILIEDKNELLLQSKNNLIKRRKLMLMRQSNQSIIIQLMKKEGQNG